MNNASLLIIENSASVQRELQTLVQSNFAFDVCLSSTSADHAVHLAKMNRPDLVIYDLPILGPEDAVVIRDIRTILPDAALIVISLFDHYRRAAATAGADAFVVKTEPKSELIQAIERLGKFDRLAV